MKQSKELIPRSLAALRMTEAASRITKCRFSLEIENSSRNSSIFVLRYSPV